MIRKSSVLIALSMAGCSLINKVDSAESKTKMYMEYLGLNMAQVEKVCGSFLLDQNTWHFLRTDKCASKVKLNKFSMEEIFQDEMKDYWGNPILIVKGADGKFRLSSSEGRVEVGLELLGK